MISYVIIFLLLLIALIIVAVYIYQLRRTVDEMHGMMTSMIIGMTAGLITSTLFLIPTGNFLWGVIIGSVSGLLFGLPLGKLGGQLGIMEGVAAGPMGGMMGAMLGQMVRPFNLEIFLPFFVLIILLFLVSISSLIHHHSNCCATAIQPAHSQSSKQYFYFLSGLGIVIFLVSIFLSFPLEPAYTLADLQKNINSTDIPSSQNLTDSSSSKINETQQTTIKKKWQEASILITASQYLPNTIIAKKGLPLRLYLSANETAGCGRDIIFPDFNVRAIVQTGETKMIEIMPKESGIFPFSCSMNMLRGQLVVQ